MKSKWIDEIETQFYSNNKKGDLTYINETLERIDKLLRLAMYSVEDEILSDKIRKEVEDANR